MAVNSLTRALLAAALAGGAAVAVAQNADPHAGLQPLESVRAAAERGLRKELGPVSGVELNARALDPRLRLPACQAPLQTHAVAPRGSQARVLVKVDCASGNSWSLNVPVEIRRELTVFVLRRALARDEAVLPADVVAEKRVVPGLASPFISRAEDLAGRLARRPLTEGTALTVEALSPALLIHRGQDVTLAANAGGIEVRAPGRALADASARQRLRVQNLNSLKVVEGIAESGGVVRVSP
jgi:flagellar basal body P-ring formation protein FlgA